ncbi:hypothetical protein H2248_008416 [Termitomyces sp. 'cryptogamus']|nr:hypothetical protein H2248_008416 [Termitomyces sp. 'cryptogamus']
MFVIDLTHSASFTMQSSLSDAINSLVINDQQLQHGFLCDTFLKWNNLEMNSLHCFSQDFEGLLSELRDMILKNKISNTLPQWVYEITTACLHRAGNAALGTAEAQLSICQNWSEDLARFFHIGTITKFDNNPVHAVDALHQMCAVQARIYKKSSWDQAVWQSGLADVVGVICQPDTDLEWSSTDIAQSFRYYCWKETLGEIFDQWMPDNARTNFKAESQPSTCDCVPRIALSQLSPIPPQFFS